ncbi:sepiapterin reductase [Solea senegalensis]|uniref:Sepiapterin reductase n=1 Tax=Solea senegalensis TaxID=28829 RepID=A0AAV6R2H6_SOLSE|nr:sepiapterin reductase a [Solea senegalensis]KAG7499552.1 sepiapterin reductase [Solea senegalensis]
MSIAAGTDLGRALCIITGASRGFGQAVARHLSQRVSPGSAFVLAARSGNDLRSVRAELLQEYAGLLVECVEADLAHAEGQARVISAAKQCFSADMDHVILVNNAASLGDVSRYTRDFTNMAEVDSYLSLNVSSCLCLTASTLEAFPQRPGLRRTVVNVSSLCAVQPFPSWVLYCTGKAARDMMFRVLAEEEPDVRVLNYAPGPMDTDIYASAKSRTADPNIRRSFTAMWDQGQVLTCDESCTKLMKLLLDDSYVSGAHIDVYDV